MISYKQFSEIYDDLNIDIDYNKWINFIVDKLKPNSKILEAACGTGSVTEKLAEKLYNITAFDLSEEMLVIAYNKLRKYKNVKLLNLNMLNFKINDNFDSVLCCCDGINYLLNDEDVLKFFCLTYDHLIKNGIFIFDISTKYKYMNILGNNTFVYDEKDIFYVWENNLDLEENKLDMEINFFKKSEGDNYKRIVELQTHKLYSIKQIKLLLKKAKFKDIYIYNDYKNEQYNNRTKRAVFVAKK